MKENTSKRPHKIVILGAGSIGTQLYEELRNRKAADEIVVWNRADSKEINKYIGSALASDQAHGLFDELDGHENGGKDVPKFKFTTNLEEALDGADIVALTAGQPRGPGETRADLLVKNCPIIDNIAPVAGKVAPNANYIIVTNPVDTMTQRFKEKSGIDPNRVVGLSGELDRLRLMQAIRYQLDVSDSQIKFAEVIGQHGDAMVPLLDKIRIIKDGQEIPLLEMPEMREPKRVGSHPFKDSKSVTKLDEIKEATVKGGGRLTELLGVSDYKAPAAAITKMIASISAARFANNGKSQTINCSSFLPDEGVYIGHPVNFGADGRYEIATTPKRSPMEKIEWNKSIGACKTDLTLLPGRVEGSSVA